MFANQEFLLTAKIWIQISQPLFCVCRSGAASEMNKPEYVAFNHTLKLPNCRELLGRKIRLLWMQDGTEVYFRIKVHMDLAQYAAVGIAAEGSPMIDADFVRIFFNQSANQFATQDAFLSKQLNCDFITGGLCTDEQVIWGNPDHQDHNPN